MNAVIIRTSGLIEIVQVSDDPQQVVQEFNVKMVLVTDELQVCYLVFTPDLPNFMVSALFKTPVRGDALIFIGS